MTGYINFGNFDYANAAGAEIKIEIDELDD